MGGGLVLGLLLGNVIPAFQSHRACEEQYPLLNGHFICGGQSTVGKQGYATTENALVSYFEEELEKGTIEDGGLYFRDLYFGPIFGIRADADFAPASLLKVPLAMTYLRLAEEHPALLREELSFSSSVEDFEATSHTQQFPSPQKLKRDEGYTIEKLLEYMVAYSDNYAYELLYNYLAMKAPGELLTTYRELGIILPTSDLEETITVKDFSTVLRILYTATYLSPERSQQILTWLSEYHIPQGLVAGVPEEVTVASKFGERFLEGGSKQFHNCGIIYYPGNPYLLCVMTKGREWDDLTRIVEQVSRIIYEEVDARNNR